MKYFFLIFLLFSCNENYHHSYYFIGDTIIYKEKSFIIKYMFMDYSKDSIYSFYYLRNFNKDNDFIIINENVLVHEK